jgi:hypothetical protein
MPETGNSWSRRRFRNQENYNFSLVKGKEFLFGFSFLKLPLGVAEANPTGWGTFQNAIFSSNAL